MKIKENLSEKKYGYGVRHIQASAMALAIVALFIARSSMGVAVLSMTDVTRKDDPNIPTFKWDKNTQGLILSSFFWGYAVMQIPAGLLSKRYGGKPIILVALIANAFVCGLVPVLVNVGGWRIVCACRVVMGLTQACLFPANHTLLGRWLPAHERTSFSGLIYSGTQLGTIIAMPLSGLLSETALGWKSIFYSISAITSVAAIVWFFFAASTPSEHPLMTEKEKMYIEKELNVTTAKSTRIPWGGIFRTPALWATMVTHVGASCSFVLFFVDMPTYLEKGLHISLKNSAALSALPYIGMMVGGIVSTSASEKIQNNGYISLIASRRIFNSISYIGLAAGLVVLAFLGPDNQELAVMTLIATLTLNGFYTSGFFMSFLDISPNYAGVMLSVSNFVANFGSIMIPILTGFVLQNDPTDLSRWRIMFFIVAGLSVVTNFALVLFGSAERQAWDDPNYVDKPTADPDEMMPTLRQKKEKDST